MQCKSLWIKASAKCINVNVNVSADSRGRSGGADSRGRSGGSDSPGRSGSADSRRCCGKHLRGAGTRGRWRGAGTGGRWRGAGARERWWGAGSGSGLQTIPSKTTNKPRGTWGRSGSAGLDGTSGDEDGLGRTRGDEDELQTPVNSILFWVDYSVTAHGDPGTRRRGL